jgi:prefoldin subunit 5
MNATPDSFGDRVDEIIDTLTGLKQLPTATDAEIAQIDMQIDALQGQIAGKADFDLSQALADPKLQAAVDALKAATDALTAEAGQIKNVAAGLQKAMQAIDAVTKLAAAIGGAVG